MGQMEVLGNDIAPVPKDEHCMTSAERPETLGCQPETSTHALESYCRHEPYVDAREGAAFLHMHPKTLMRLARDGSVRAYSFSEGTRRHWRFLISELDKWMKTRVNSSTHPVTFVSPGRRK
jgi:hypothetical protein